MTTHPSSKSFTSGLAIRYAPLAGIFLVAAGAALWGTDGALRQPLVDTWSPWTIVLYEHVILVACVAAFVVRHREQLKKLDRMGWLSLIVIAWGGSALATLAFTTAFEYGNPNVVVLLQKTQPLWAIAAAAIVVREVPRPLIIAVFVPAAVGTYLLSFGWTAPAEGFSDNRGKAALLALVAAALWGSATAFGRRASPPDRSQHGHQHAIRAGTAVPAVPGFGARRGRALRRPRPAVATGCGCFCSRCSQGYWHCFCTTGGCEPRRHRSRPSPSWPSLRRHWW